MKCVLVGNFGVSNMGDEALNDYFLSTYKDCDWTVISAKPKKDELARLPIGFRSFFGMKWWGTIVAIKRSDAVVFGGGSLFTDTESILACFLWALHAWTARLFGVPVILAFQGIGPFRTRLGESITRSVVSHAAFVSVRDEESARRMRNWKMNIDCIQSADPIFISIQNDHSVRSKNVIALIPRHNSSDAFLLAAKEACEAHPNAPVCILLLQPDSNDEKKYAHELLKAIDRHAQIVSVKDLAKLCEELRNAVIVVTERYHGAIPALVLGIPVTIISQCGGDKLDQLKEYASAKKSVSELQEKAKYGENALKNILDDLVKR